ncbi:hypothetical protein JXL21_09250 [Candidatus Bathyarchaeota archaeon]|nr:hypothetical protein [Candidatus Bathyarchaeota archaeon]
MSEGIPSFEEALNRAEDKMSRSLGGVCRITVHNSLDEELKRLVMAIDHEKFRRELWYDRDEIEKRVASKGFLLLLLHLEGKPVGFDYGYDDDEKGAFFSDSSASLIERRGVGSTLFALEIIYCYERGYRATKLTTEEYDEQGRPLMEIWGKFGFTRSDVDKANGIEMRLELTHDAVAKIYHRYIKREVT